MSTEFKLNNNYIFKCHPRQIICPKKERHETLAHEKWSLNLSVSVRDSVVIIFGKKIILVKSKSKSKSKRGLSLTEQMRHECEWMSERKEMETDTCTTYHRPHLRKAFISKFFLIFTFLDFIKCKLCLVRLVFIDTNRLKCYWRIFLLTYYK